MYTITRKSSSRRQSANSMDSSDQLIKDETNHGSHSIVSSSGEEESDEADESGSDSGTSTVTCTSLHSRGGISSGSGLTSSSGSSGWSSAGQAVYSPMKLTKRWRKTHEAEAENKLRYMNQDSEMAIEPSDQEDEDASRPSRNALDLSCYGHGMDYCSDSRSLEVVANWLDRNHHHAMSSGGPLSPPSTPPTMLAENESLSSINRLTGEQHLNGMGFLVPSPSALDSSNFLSPCKQQLMDPSTQVMTPKSSPCCSPNNGIKNSQGQIEFRSFNGSLSAPSTSCSSPSSNYHNLNNSRYPAAASMMSSRPLFPSSSSRTTAVGIHQLSGSIENGSDQFSCLYLLASAAVSELERQRQIQKHQSQTSPQNPAATNNTSTVVQTLTVVS